MGRSRYDVVVFRWMGNDEYREVRRLGEATLDMAQESFTYQCQQLKWSLAHRNRFGIPKDDDIIIQLYDNREGFELREHAIMHDAFA